VREGIKLLWARDFVKNVAHTLASKGVLIAIGLVSNIIITRSLGPERLGVYALVMTLIMLGIQFGHLGMHSSNTYFVAKDRSVWGQLVVNSLVIACVSGIVISGLLILVDYSFPSLFSIPEEISYWYILVIATPLALISMLFKNLLLGVQHIKANNYYEIFARALYATLVVTLYLTGVLDIYTVLLAFLCEHALSAIFLGRYMYRNADRPLKFSFNLFRTNFNYGIKAYLAIFLSFLVIRSDILLLNYFLDSQNVGFYQASVAIVDQFKVLGAVVAGILMPKLTGTSSIKKKFELNLKVVKTISLILGFVSVILIMLSKPLILLIYGADYLPSVASFRILVIAMLFLSIETILAQFLASIGMPMQVVWFWLICFVFNLVLNIILIPQYGEMGAAISSALSYFLILVLIYFHARHRVKGT